MTASIQDPLATPPLPDGPLLLSRRVPPDPAAGTNRLISATLAIAFLALLAIEILRQFSSAKIGALAMVAAWPGLVAIHELGHALAARLVGWRICRMVIGFGGTVASFRWGETRVELRAIPLSGFVLPAPRHARGGRLKSAFIYAAGPLAEALVFGLLYAALGPALLRSSDVPSVIAAQGVAVAVGLGLFFNVLPLPTREGFTDGLGMLASFGLSEEHLERIRATPARLVTQDLLEQGQVERALATLDEERDALGDCRALALERSRRLIELGRADDALRALEPYWEEASRPENQSAPWVAEALALSALAHCELSYAAAKNPDVVPGDLAFADEQISHATKHWPIDFVRLVDARVSLELGRFHEAREKLEVLLAIVPRDEAIDQAECLLCFADHRRGDTAPARERFERLSKRGVRGPLFERLRRELGS